MSEDAIKIFYSYSRKDLDMRNALEDHLSALREAGRISTWHDLELEAGTEWEPAILHKLDTADIILLLISSSFIASKYCYGTELKRAIARHNEGTARVIPIILRPCDWNHSDVPFSRLNVLPTHAKAITSWSDPEEAFTIVAQKIRKTVDQLRAKKQSGQQAAEPEGLRLEQLRQQLLAQTKKSEQQERERQRQAQLIDTDDPSSERNIDYTLLRNLLKARKWKEADQETARRMCEAVERQEEGWLRYEDTQGFPCADLRTIDQLWAKYSNGKFGFSVQKKIWQKHGSPTEYNQKWKNFGVEVGWRSKGMLGWGEWKDHSELTFDTSAPEGHFPRRFLVSKMLMSNGLVSSSWWWLGGWHLFSRTETCRL